MSAPDRLGELVAHHRLDDSAHVALDRLLDLLELDPVAPTTVRARAVAVDVHVADALVALDLLPVRQAGTIVDLGAGAGVPGLVLAAALPRAEVHLVESSRRKCAFLERAIAGLGLRNADVVCARAEEWTAGVVANDLVTARALAPLPVVVEYAAPLLALGGALVAWKGQRDDAEHADGLAAAKATGLELADVRAVTPWEGALHRTLYLYVKVRSTPNRFPRRPGIARKRPLRA